MFHLAHVLHLFHNTFGLQINHAMSIAFWIWRKKEIKMVGEKKFKWTWAQLEANSKLFDISFQLSLGSTNGNTYIHIVKGAM